MSREILHVMPSVDRAFGGPVEALIGYVRAARAMGDRCTVAAPGSADGARWMADRLPPDTPLQLFGAVGPGSAAISLPLLRWLRGEAPRFDVVHVHGCFNLVSDLAAGTVLRGGTPLVVRPFGTLSRYTFTHRNALAKRIWFRYVLRARLARASRLHFTTQEELDEAALSGLDIAGRGVVVPPPVDDHANGVAHADRSAPVALFLSRLHPKKNVEALLDAWVTVTARVPGARLVVAGRGDDAYVATLRARVRDLGLEAAVHFAGFVEGARKQELLRAARLFVLPSFQENFGVAVLEAMAAGIPVVITAEVQLASFVREHRLGIVVNGAPPALADALVAALHDEALLDHCERTGRATVRAQFSVDAVGRMLDALYGAVSAPVVRPAPAVAR